MILVRSLKKSFGSRHVLTGLDMCVEPGVVTLLVGSNGAGKTTTLRLMAGLSDADVGMIFIEGSDLRRERKAALARVAYLPQAPRFHPRLTVWQTTRFYAQLRGRTDEDARIALGGVATKPWRAAAAEKALRDQPVADEVFAQAAAVAMAGAQPRQHNAFKIPLARQAIVRALVEATR